ncbi:uncharacterized protein BO80DRAFT_86268 [Aspergillus ibericus CBS 121593]|uniref:Uncharacterized protein n=1 Tax=Aspergillus ibericus CBS 121593 TaxID=1448316 RepID=A0A395HEA6_9EURO|nr:hypothetical protein BO80DRAFT_86268 [Aspergillus ibericus CBS 121593]RAL05996.1 hypothetical protein BO80DRAFT_86268 [Aspergillus ibericus CBS 121593]
MHDSQSSTPSPHASIPTAHAHASTVTSVLTTFLICRPLISIFTSLYKSPRSGGFLLHPSEYTSSTHIADSPYPGPVRL